MLRSWKVTWRTCDNQLSDISPDNRHVLGTPAYADGFGPTTLDLLATADGSVARSFTSARNGRSATYFDEVWEDADPRARRDLPGRPSGRSCGSASTARWSTPSRPGAGRSTPGRRSSSRRADRVRRARSRGPTLSRPQGYYRCTMSDRAGPLDDMHRQIAGSLTGRVSKWIVLAAVLGITVIMAGFSAKLTSVQNNEASSWLPESAESTQVLEELSETVDPNDIPTLVVYQRDGGLTEDDLAQIEDDGGGDRRDRRRHRPGRADARGRGGGRGPGGAGADAGVRRRRGRLPLLRAQLRHQRLERHPRRRRPDPRHRDARRRTRSTSPATAARPPTPPRPSRASTPT